MSDLISRQDAIEAIASRDETDGTVKVFTGREVNEILSALPSADRPTGEWICMGDVGVTECNQCGWSIEEYVGDYKFCPNCGAKMGGDDE